MKVTTISLLAASLMFTGCVGGPEDDICTRAAMHLESCTGSSGGVLDTCSPTKAQRLLNTDCTTLQNGTRSTSFNLFDWLGNMGNGGHNEECHPGDPHCQHGGHHCEPGDPSCHGGHHEPDGPQGWENGKECYCDNKCHILKDCCHHCGGGHNDPHGGHHEPWHGGGLEEPGGGYGNHQGGWCSWNGGHNYRRCRQCGWQFCLPSGQWAPCQRPEDNKYNHACGGSHCQHNGHCGYY